MQSAIQLDNQEKSSSYRGAAAASVAGTYIDDSQHNLDNIKKLPTDDKMGIINNLTVDYDWSNPITQPR